VLLLVISGFAFTMSGKDPISYRLAVVSDYPDSSHRAGTDWCSDDCGPAICICHLSAFYDDFLAGRPTDHRMAISQMDSLEYWPGYLLSQ